MCYYIARNITRDSHTFVEKVTVIRDFVHENVLPIGGYPNRLDTVGIEKLTSGIGWCDQQSRVFMQLAGAIGITSRLLFLRYADDGSPHTVAEALAPDGRWVIVDSAYKLDLINKKGGFASQGDIRDDITIVSRNFRVAKRAKFEKLWSDTRFLSVYSNPPVYVITKKALRFDPLRIAPTSWMRPIIKRISDGYLKRLEGRAGGAIELKMLKARTLHLLGYYAAAKKIYGEIIENGGDLPLKRKAIFFYALALKYEKRYEDAYRYLTAAIEKDKENPYRKYLYGLRADTLKNLERPAEADEDWLKTGYMPEV